MSPFLQSGALLACGIVNTGVRNECDPALALLSDYVLHASDTMRLGAVIGSVQKPLVETQHVCYYDYPPPVLV